MVGAPVGNVISPVLLLDRVTVGALLTLNECISVVEAAFEAHARGAAFERGLLHVQADRGEFHIKVGGLRGERTYFATKINGGFFHNRGEYGLPNIIGLILLCDGGNGTPLAIIESGLITGLRTGAATAVAAKYLARPNSHTVTICGAGVQAEMQLRALKAVLPIENALIWSRSGAETFASRMHDSLGIAARAITDLSHGTRESDIVVTCTPAKRWYLGRKHIRLGTFIAAVGTDSPDKQELEPELVAQSSIVADILEQGANVGELHHAISAGLMQLNQVRGELGDVITGHAPRRVRDDEIIVFDSTGTALQDVAAAAVVYERASVLAGLKTFAFWGY
jgi:alanine dehydrogenase